MLHLALCGRSLVWPSLQLVRQKKGGVKLLRNGKVFLIEKRDLWLWKKDFFWSAQIVFLQEWSFFNKNLHLLRPPLSVSLLHNLCLCLPLSLSPFDQLQRGRRGLTMLITPVSELAEKMAEIGPCRARRWYRLSRDEWAVCYRNVRRCW